MTNLTHVAGGIRAWLWPVSIGSALLLAACGGAGLELEAQASPERPLLQAATFVDLADYLLRTEHSTTALGDVERSLGQAFDDVCMDTFCEGDFGNLTPLSWRCSVEEATGQVGQCIWVFAGSVEFVDAESGAIEVEEKVATCHIPVQGTARELLDTLLREDADSSVLNRSLPGVDTNVYNSLSRCL